jgi:hypothetical protein
MIQSDHHVTHPTLEVSGRKETGRQLVPESATAVDPVEISTKEILVRR